MKQFTKATMVVFLLCLQAATVHAFGNATPANKVNNQKGKKVNIIQVKMRSGKEYMKFDIPLTNKYKLSLSI